MLAGNPSYLISDPAWGCPFLFDLRGFRRFLEVKLPNAAKQEMVVHVRKGNGAFHGYLGTPSCRQHPETHKRRLRVG